MHCLDTCSRRNHDLDLCNYVSCLHNFDSLGIHLSRDLLVLEILIFVKIKKRKCIALNLEMQVQNDKSLFSLKDRQM